MASLDRTIAGQPEGIVEIKTSASPRWSMYPVPPEVVVQVTTQMGIVGAQWCDVVALLGGLVFKIERVTFDPELWAEIQRSAMLFLEAIDTNTPPALEALDAAAYALATPQDSDVVLVADEKIERVYDQLRECNTELHFLEQKKGALEIIIKEAIGDRGGIAGGNWAIYWRQSRPTETTDWKLAAQAAGASPEVVAAHTTVKPGTRRFIVRDGGLND